MAFWRRRYVKEQYLSNGRQCYEVHSNESQEIFGLYLGRKTYQEELGPSTGLSDYA